MLERVVEHWLTKAGERTYEVPFTQMLIAEGYKVLHGPVHHPFEHGKDIIAYSPDGELCAFQLKGGDLGLSELDLHQGQLFTLLATAITYPGVEPQRRPDRVFLVTNGSLTPPARDRLVAINTGNRELQLGVIELIEKEQLLGRFRATYGQYIPTEAYDLRVLFQLLTEDGKSLPDLDAFASLQREILERGAERKSQYARANAAALLLTAYAIGSWERIGNHLAVAQAWLTLGATIMYMGARTSYPEDVWSETYDLAFASARNALSCLVEEGILAEDLVVPDLTEGFVYPTRSLLVCGFAAAFLLSEQLQKEDATTHSRIADLLKREVPFFQLEGEVGVPFLIAIACALHALGEYQLALNIVASCAHTIAITNAPGSKEALPGPYHSFEECLLRSISDVGDRPLEHFAGRSFGLPLALDWLARRNLRNAIESDWKCVTHIGLCEFVPSSSIQLLAARDSDSMLQSWYVAQPQSWRELVASARALRESALPQVLWRKPEFLPYLGLLFPHRFTSSVAKAIDYYFSPSQIVEIDFDMEESQLNLSASNPS